MNAPVNATIDTRADIAIAVTDYVREADAFNQASDRFQTACSRLRGTLPKGRLVVRANYQNYLVESDGNGNFDVTPIETL